jgi:hypothetical protein
MKNTIKLLSLIAVLSFHVSVHASPFSVCLPDEETLKKKAINANVDPYFIEKTNLFKKLANRDNHPRSVAIDIDLAIYDFAKDMGDSTTAKVMQLEKPLILKAILQDYPEAIQLLRNEGTLKD